MDDAIGIRKNTHDFEYAPYKAFQYIKKDSKHVYYVHDNIREQLSQHGDLPDNVTDNPYEADFVLAYSPSAPNDIENSPFIIKRWFGTREVNYRYYSTWKQDTWGMKRDKPNPIIILPDDAGKYGLLE